MPYLHKAQKLKYAKEYYAKNKERYTSDQLKRLYGLTLKQYEEVLKAQGGVCKICRRPPRKKRLFVDHDHSCCPGVKTCGKCVRRNTYHPE